MIKSDCRIKGLGEVSIRVKDLDAMRKFYEEVVLLEQIYVIDGESKVRKAVEAMAKDVGAPVVLAGFVRFVLGEGVEREEGDFAAEVAAAAKG